MKSDTFILKLLLFLPLTLIFTILLAVTQQSINLDSSIIILPQLGPAIGFMALVLIFKSLRTPIHIAINSKIAKRGVIAIVVPLALFTFAFFICSLIGIKVNATNHILDSLPYMLGGMLIGAIGEELGWRSFLQPNFEKKYPVLPSTLITGFIWCLWHIGNYENGILFMMGFLLFIVSTSILLRFILEGTNYNLVISTTFHLSINTGYFIYFKSTLTNFEVMLLNGIVWSLPAILLIVMDKFVFKKK